MAKKTIDDKKKDDIKKVKQSLYLNASYVMDMERTLISWSPAYDAILGGGLLSGSLTLMAGRAKSGKTTSYLQLVSNAQKPQYGGRYWNAGASEKRGDKPGRPVIFYNVENRLTKRDLMSIPGLDLSEMFDADGNYVGGKFGLVSTTDKNTLYLEDYFQNIEKTIELFPGCIILIDSIGALCSKKIAAATDDGQVRDNASILSSYFMKRIGPLIMAKDIIMLNVLHKVANVGAMGNQSKTSVTGGSKLKYGANNIIDIRWSEVDINNDNCYILHLESETSELGPPDIQADAYLRFGKGLWNSYEIILLTTDADCNHLFGVHKNGAWFSFAPELTGAEKPIKIQGIINAANYVEENKKVYNKLYQQYASSNWTNTNLYK